MLISKQFIEKKRKDFSKTTRFFFFFFFQGVTHSNIFHLLKRTGFQYFLRSFRNYNWGIQKPRVGAYQASFLWWVWIWRKCRLMIQKLHESFFFLGSWNKKICRLPALLVKLPISENDWGAETQNKQKFKMIACHLNSDMWSEGLAKTKNFSLLRTFLVKYSFKNHIFFRYIVESITWIETS